MDQHITHRPALGLSSPPPPQLLPVRDRMRTAGLVVASVGGAAMVAVFAFYVVFAMFADLG